MKQKRGILQATSQAAAGAAPESCANWASFFSASERRNSGSSRTSKPGTSHPVSRLPGRLV